ncbi:hypothetical protein PMIN01_04812 [Paraphaeosphaeria minitans]|uniref:Uncharacterized protein n=1 Tax=Paraphaeosphaeria minitans TaxID=565426 RepID=A0A9P6KRN6_9PLEO|nr:hypothetical protein PMIN01_04812 [Paraphaeosphaeria minitans]
MPLNPESIIELVPLLVTSPPTVYWIYKLTTRPRTINETSDLPLHRSKVQDEPHHHSSPCTSSAMRHGHAARIS